MSGSRGSTPSALRIRRADDDDAPGLSALAERTFREAFASVNTVADMHVHCAATYSDARQLAEIRDPRRETWVCDIDGRLAAYAQLRLDGRSLAVAGARAVEIQRFYVDASHHGGGLASALMEHVLARTEAAGFAPVWLGVWERNPRAIALYRKWGFEIVGEQTFMLGNDLQRDLVMCRREQAANPGPGTPSRPSV